MSKRRRKDKYVALSVGFWRDHDLQGLALADRGLFAKALSYCGDVQNDGVMTATDWAIVVAGEVPQDVPPSVARLVSFGVLTETGCGGYSIDSYDEWNMTRDEIDANRKAERERKRKQRANGSNKPNLEPIGDMEWDMRDVVPEDVPQ